MSGTLYLVATPIGNLNDMSPRALKTLEEADFIAAEDTRVSLKLMNHFEIKKPLLSYHEHNHVSAGQQIVQRLLAGENCALVTDAGTPAISDPGEDIVKLCAQHDIPVYSIPGCCALISGLAVSGLPTGRFTFEGFLSTNKRSRREHLASLLGEKRTMIFYEAPHKLLTTLEDMCDAFGEERRISLSREITKLHEQTLRTTLGGALEHFRETAPKGEFVLVLDGAPEEDISMLTIEDAVALVAHLQEEKGLKTKEAVRQVSADTGIGKNELYDAVLKSR